MSKISELSWIFKQWYKYSLALRHSQENQTRNNFKKCGLQVFLLILCTSIKNPALKGYYTYTVTSSWVSKLICIINILKIPACLLAMHQEHVCCPCFYHPVLNIDSKHISWRSPSLCVWLSALGMHLPYHKVPNRRHHFGTRPRSSFRTCPGTLFLSTGGLGDVSALGEGRPWGQFRSESHQEGSSCDPQFTGPSWKEMLENAISKAP